MKRHPAFVVLLALFLAAAPAALAHPGHEGHELTWDFTTGFTHPLFGWDHLVAMLAVGLWAAQLGGRARWFVPAAFVTVMAIGAALAQNRLMIPAVEQAIAASVLVLGLLIANATKVSVGVGMALVGLFAMFHGFAHGAEMPATARGFSYGAGFIFATALIHAVGVSVGLLAAPRAKQVALAAGWAITACGIALFAV